jgi:hypothetical protein
VIPRWPIALTAGRGLQLLPFALATVIVGGMALQSRLLPVRYVPIEIPSTAGMSPGAAPQESVPSPTVAAPIQVLPSESMPAENSSALNETGVATAAEGARAPGKWADYLPRETAIEEDTGAGNLMLHPKQRQANAISSLLANIMRSLKRVHPTALPSIKVLATHNPRLAPNRAKIEMPRIAAAANPHLMGWTLGGPVAPRDFLGGPAPLGARFAPSVNGATLVPRH